MNSHQQRASHLSAASSRRAVKDEMDATQRLARITGVLYLSIFVFGFFAVVVQANLVAPGDAATTADNILTSEWLFRLGIISWLIVFLADVAVSIALYVLLKPVSDMLSLVAAGFRLAMAAILGINLVNQFNAVFVLTDAESLTGFDPDEVNALASFFLDAFDTGVSVALVFLPFTSSCSVTCCSRRGTFRELWASC